MILSLSAPLQNNNRQIMADAIKSSIAIDERDQVLIVSPRCLTTTRGLFDILLGIERDYGTGPDATCNAIQNVIKRACAKRRGRQGDSDIGVGCRGQNGLEATFAGKLDTFDDSLYNQFCAAVSPAVADGCYAEQYALFLLSPAPPILLPAHDDEEVEPPLFPNLVFISRDRSHKYRSVQKSTWDKATGGGGW